jgi:hypothetical protein
MHNKKIGDRHESKKSKQFNHEAHEGREERKIKVFTFFYNTFLQNKL